MKKLLCTIFAFVLVLSLTACGKPTFEERVIEDVTAEIDRIYNVYEIEVTVYDTDQEGEYYYAEGRIVMEGMTLDYKTNRLKTTYEATYALRGDEYVLISIDIDDDWDFA